VGETLTLHDGKIAIGNNTFRQWLEKIRTSGKFGDFDQS